MDWEGGLQVMMVDYFNKLFEATETSWQTVINCIDSKVINDHNGVLLKHVEEQEVKQAIFHMQPDKSPARMA